MRFSTEEVAKKNELIDKATVQLKKEFSGIDFQIDSVMDNLRTWILFPELQDRPTIINLWGMSGCGKTALVKRISELLDLEKDYVYFNFAQIEEMSAWEIEDMLEDTVSNETSNKMFIYDEFQYAATLDEGGCEKEKKTGMKTFWELLDTGILHKRTSYDDIRKVYTIYKYLNLIDMTCPIKLNENGEWINSEECLKFFSKYEVDTFSNYFNTNNNKNKPDIELPMYAGPGNDTCIINSYYAQRIYVLYSRTNKNVDIFDFNKMLSKLTVPQLKDLLMDCCNNVQKGYDLNFKNSIIFVIGNLDEAYNVSYDMNPDMSPDQFHEFTKRLTVVDIKEALQKRFRNEQIARLGNIHVIYPSFNSKTFNSIIQSAIDKYIATTKEETGFNIECDNSINKIIYKEGVFPTQGTRPVYSTIQEILRSKLPFVLKNSYSDGFDIDTIKYSFKNGYTIAEVFKDGESLAKYKFKEKLRVENLRGSKKDGNQALVAVHESGHFVMYAKLNKEMPESVRSVTTDTKSGGFMIGKLSDNKPVSAQELLNSIKIALGGYVAEEIIFGQEHMTTGASSDFEKATILASKFVRKYCLGSFKYVSTYLRDGQSTSGGMLINENNQDDINEDIQSYISKCLNEVRATFRNYEWMKMLKASAKYLSEHSSLPKDKMVEFYNLVSEKERGTKEEKDYYKSIVDKF